jgi:4-azaleucine resistance transporter AzlC
MSFSADRASLRAGVRAVAPMLIGVAPFGMVAGATPAANGLGADVAVGFSTIVFAGASQLAAINVLSDGGSALVAVLAACTINLRMLLYSASIGPYFAHERLARRLGVAYLMTDQAYALSITRWLGDDPGDGLPETRRSRLGFYIGAGLTLWCVWQLSTIVGLLIGKALPAGVHLDFAVPLVFLVLLVPSVTNRPSLVAAVTGGGVAVLAAQLGAGPLSIIIGSLAGIAAGALVDTDSPVAAPRGGAT